MTEETRTEANNTLKKMEEALLLSEAKFQVMAEIAPVAISMYQGEKMVFANTANCTITGYSKEELMSMNMAQLVAPDSLPFILAQFERAKRANLPVLRYKHKLLTKQGETRWVEVAASRFLSAGDETWISVTLDITEHLEKEQMLREREAWYSQLVNLLPDGVVVHRQGKITFLNKSVLKILGIESGGEIIGQSVMNFVHPDYRQVAVERIQHLLATGESTPFFEEKFLRLDGSELDAEVAAFPFIERGETVVQVVFRDITARKQAEHTLQQYAHRLELLSEIDRASLTAQPMEEIARSALISLRELVPCRRASVSLFEPPPSPTVTILAVEGIETTPIPSGTTFSKIDYRGMLLNLEQGKARVFSNLGSLTQSEAVGAEWSKFGNASLAVVPLFIHDQLIGALNLSSDQVDAFQETHIDIAREVADRLAVAMQNARLFAEVNAANERLQGLSHRLVRVQEEERRYVARELHDEIGQSLTALNLSLQLATHAPPDQVAARLQEAQEMISDLMHRTRELSLALRPAMLDDLGLRPSLEWFFGRYTRQTQLNVDFTHAGLDQRCGENIDIAVFRIIQEALTNVARHAQTEKVQVQLKCAKPNFNILIQDDGVGFDVGQTLHQSLSSGLSGMTERVKALSGSINIESETDAGARIVVHLPLDEIPHPSQEAETS